MQGNTAVCNPQTEQGLLMPPAGFDSACARMGKEGGDETVVLAVYDNSQALPEYIVHLK